MKTGRAGSGVCGRRAAALEVINGYRVRRNHQGDAGRHRAAQQRVRADPRARSAQGRDRRRAGGNARWRSSSSPISTQGEWGDKFEANKTLAERAFRWAKPGETTSAQIEALTGSADMLKIFARIGEAMGEAALVTDKGNGGGFGGKSAGQLEAELNRFVARDDFRAALKEGPRSQRYQDFMEQRQQLIDQLAKARAA
jgi:hypothetical protein